MGFERNSMTLPSSRRRENLLYSIRAGPYSVHQSAPDRPAVAYAGYSCLSWATRTYHEVETQGRVLLPLSSLGLLLLPGSFVILNRKRHNPVHPITTGIHPIRNMNRKRKDLLNRSQEYQLQYLSAKEESCQ